MQLKQRMVTLYLWLVPALAFAATGPAATPTNTMGEPSLQHQDDFRISWALATAIVALFLWGIAIRKRNRMEA